jgi:hypothetical protein
MAQSSDKAISLAVEIFRCDDRREYRWWREASGSGDAARVAGDKSRPTDPEFVVQVFPSPRNL